jgi:clan AA aspartic protease
LTKNGEKTMGLTYAEITLANSTDADLVRRGAERGTKCNTVGHKDVRQMTVSALVDSGAYMLTFDESVKTQLGLNVFETMEVELADGSHQECEIVGPVNVHFKNRSTSCRALVLPGATEVLLGAIPLEDLDVVIDPKSQQLVVHPLRPYIAGTKVK